MEHTPDGVEPGYPLRDRIRQLRVFTDRHFPQSRLTKPTAEQVGELLARYPDLPEHLALLASEFGHGLLGDGGYILWLPGEPLFDVLDPVSGLPRSGVVFVGSNNGEFHEAYDREAGWQFGMVGEDHTFEPHLFETDMVEFLERLLHAWVRNQEA
jgi:hypothetical protein